jgi:hypothetical protein
MLASVRALSSAGERSLHTGEVAGSIPAAPTIIPIHLGNAANTRNPSFAFSASSHSGNLAKQGTHPTA